MATWRLTGFRLLALIAAAVCMALLIDSLRPTPAFCGFRSGCDAVVQTAYGRPLGIPLPGVGLTAFLVFFACTLVPHRPIGKFVGPMAVVAGLSGLVLIGIQVFVIRKTCPMCLVVDSAALLLAAVEWGFPPAQRLAPAKPPAKLPWLALAALFVSAPVAWGVVKPSPEVPRQVKSHWVDGRINVVEITDFACPYCSESHPALRQFLEEHADKVHFVRIVAPLEEHDHSFEAAKAYFCAQRQGRGEELAEALFAADDLSPAALVRMAKQARLDLNRFRADLKDDALDETIEQTLNWVKADEGDGLPQFWIQETRLVGAQTRQSLEAALARVERAATR
jgi:predicted DsbA family dithiol-disulfide isomerase/uncharacterized membrane protein